MKSLKITALLVLTSLTGATGLAAEKTKASGKSGTQVAQMTISTKGQELAYDKVKLTAKAGQKVKLTFKNTGLMQHNWVLIKAGTADDVASKSIAAGAAKGWLASDSPNVLAHTKMLDPGKSETIEFTAPSKPGVYLFICTFPGHASVMRGNFIVN